MGYRSWGIERALWARKEWVMAHKGQYEGFVKKNGLREGCWR